MKKNKWIIVKDKMPCEMQPVLIWDGDELQVDRLVDADEQPGLWWEYNFDNPGVTHWMPLPEPPKQEKK